MVPLVARAEEAVLTRAQPYLETHGRDINSLACKGLDHSEDLMRQLAQRTAVLRAMRQRTISKVTDTAFDAMVQAETGVTALTNRAVGLADKCVDLLLPEQAAQEGQELTPVAEMAPDNKENTADAGPGPQDPPPRRLGREALKTLNHVRAVGTKTQARVTERVLKQLHAVQARSQDAVEAMKPYTVDLIAYARDSLRPEAPADDEQQPADATAEPPASAYTKLTGHVSARTAELKTLLAARMAEIRAAAEQNYGYLVVQATTLEKQAIDQTTAVVKQYPRLETALQAMLRLPGAQSIWLVVLRFMPDDVDLKKPAPAADDTPAEKPAHNAPLNPEEQEEEEEEEGEDEEEEEDE